MITVGKPTEYKAAKPPIKHGPPKEGLAGKKPASPGIGADTAVISSFAAGSNDSQNTKAEIIDAQYRFYLDMEKEAGIRFADPYNLDEVSTCFYKISKKYGFSQLREKIDEYLSAFYFHGGKDLPDDLDLTVSANLKKRPSNEFGQKEIDCKNFADIAKFILSKVTAKYICDAQNQKGWLRGLFEGTWNRPFKIRYVVCGDPIQTKGHWVRNRNINDLAKQYSWKEGEEKVWSNHLMLLVSTKEGKFLINNDMVWQVSGNSDQSIIKSIAKKWKEKGLKGLPQYMEILPEGKTPDQTNNFAGKNYYSTSS